MINEIMDNVSPEIEQLAANKTAEESGLQDANETTIPLGHANESIDSSVEVEVIPTEKTVIDSIPAEPIVDKGLQVLKSCTDFCSFLIV